MVLPFLPVGVFRSHNMSIMLPPTANKPIMAVVTDSFSSTIGEDGTMFGVTPSTKYEVGE